MSAGPPSVPPTWPPLPQRGFALPLALLGGLMLLLGALAAQSALHQSRMRNAVSLGQRRLEDGLSSAAHRLVGMVGSRHPCLLALPLEQWSSQGAVCADAAAQAALRQGSLEALAYRIQTWRPVPGSSPVGPARVELELEQIRSADGSDPGWRAAFSLDVAGDPPRVLALRELGLRGVQP